MDMISLERIDTLHPSVRVRFKDFYQNLCQMSGYRWRVVQALRTFDQQDKLYKAYRKEPARAAKAAPAGLSYHNYGLAIDILPMSDDYKEILQIMLSSWDIVGQLADKHGLIWGRSFGDKPHLEYHPHGNTVKTLLKWHLEGRYLKGTPYLDLPPF